MKRRYILFARIQRDKPRPRAQTSATVALVSKQARLWRLTVALVSRQARKRRLFPNKRDTSASERPNKPRILTRAKTSATGGERATVVAKLAPVAA